jgi:signal transduction histidine kinase
MLKFKFDDQGFRDRYTDVVMPQITRLGSLVDDLLDYSRETRLSLSEVDLNIQLRQAVHFFGDVLLASEVTARESYGAERPVSGDPDRLDQVFFNLVRNALEAQSDGGVLGVVTRTGGDEAVVLVADGGDGIPGEEQGSIFEPFFTTKSKGTGLGLAITSKLIGAHNGSIEVFSPLGEVPQADRELLEDLMGPQWPGPDRGTCFRVVIPHMSEEE